MIGRAQAIAIFWAIWSQLPFHKQPPPAPPPQPASAFRVSTDSVPRAEIAGVILPAAGHAKGTIFLCHGYCGSKEKMYGWNWIRKDLGWNLVTFDFREHGQSSHSIHLSTLGYYEIWDVKAVIDEAERRGLEKPYLIYGVSMGASIGLRWAEFDPRISGVLAVSPYQNGLTGAREFLWHRFGLTRSPLSWHRGFSQMLSVVDLPTDVKRRDDLRIWIICGERDYFPEKEQRTILSASRSPERLKRLFVIPGATHSNIWSWKGNWRVPAHDRIIRDFLDASR